LEKNNIIGKRFLIKDIKMRPYLLAESNWKTIKDQSIEIANADLNDLYE
jgi:hypothetical protein